MARQLTPFGRFLLVVCGLALMGYGLWRYGVLDRIAGVLAPDRKAEGTVGSTNGASWKRWPFARSTGRTTI